MPTLSNLSEPPSSLHEPSNNRFAHREEKDRFHHGLLGLFLGGFATRPFRGLLNI